MLKYDKKTISSWLVVLFWMILIFCLSSQSSVESDVVSRNVTKMIVESVVKIIPFKVNTGLDMVTQFNHLIRKSAHFFLYFTLGIFVINAFVNSEIKILKALIISMLLCVFYAMSDEFHQLFVQGRGGQLKDVLIDASGACCGMILYIFYIKFLKYKKVNFL